MNLNPNQLQNELQIKAGAVKKSIDARRAGHESWFNLYVLQIEIFPDPVQDPFLVQRSERMPGTGIDLIFFVSFGMI